MIKIENVVTPSPEQWKAVIRGMRNPKNSWLRSDSHFDCSEVYEYCDECPNCSGDELVVHCGLDDTNEQFMVIGPNDHDLMMRLVKGGPVHAKFRRMLPVIVDITAPTFIWAEIDTYKVGTVRNSCSFMHKGTAKPFTLEDFSSVITSEEDLQVWQKAVEQLNKLRDKYLETKDETVFEAIRCLLPSGYMQRSTLSLNYETLANMYHWRKDHRLQDWHTFCSWIKTLPYSEIITGEEVPSNG